MLGSELKMREIWFLYKEAVFQNLSIGAVFIFFWITLTGSSNAINLTDGLDGLAIGCTVTALTYGVMAYASGNFVISEYLMVSWIPGTGWLLSVRHCLGEVCLFYGLMPIPLKYLWETLVPWHRWANRNDCLDGASAFHIGDCWRNFCDGGRIGYFTGTSFKTTVREFSECRPFTIILSLRDGGKQNVIRFWILSLLCIVWTRNLKLQNGRSKMNWEKCGQSQQRF